MKDAINPSILASYIGFRSLSKIAIKTPLRLILNDLPSYILNC